MLSQKQMIACVNLQVPIAAWQPTLEEGDDKGADNGDSVWSCVRADRRFPSQSRWRNTKEGCEVEARAQHNIFSKNFQPVVGRRPLGNGFHFDLKPGPPQFQMIFNALQRNGVLGIDADGEIKVLPDSIEKARLSRSSSAPGRISSAPPRQVSECWMEIFVVNIAWGLALPTDRMYNTDLIRAVIQGGRPWG